MLKISPVFLTATFIVAVVLSILIVPVSGFTMQRYNNSNILGGDYNVTDLSSATVSEYVANLCKNYCVDDTQCVAATYQAPGVAGPGKPAQCSLKNSKPGSIVSLSGSTLWVKFREGFLSISTIPSGASVFIDGIASSTTPINVTGLDAGSHQVRLTMSGYSDYVGTATIYEGQTTYLPAILTKPTTGTLAVTSVPDSAVLFVDDVEKGRTPQTITKMSPGNHTIKLSFGGYNDFISTFTITVGQTTTINALLKPGSNTGIVTIFSQPSGASINLDGWQKGITPAVISNLKAGSHQLTLSMAGYGDWKQNISVLGGENTTVQAVLGSPVTTQVVPVKTATSGTIAIATTSQVLQETTHQVPVEVSVSTKSPGFAAALCVIVFAGFITYRKIMKR